jgi:SPP1 family predicted phage head-tail adaptor
VEDVALPDTGDILSLTRVEDGQGGFIEAWGTASANVKCRMDYRSGMEIVAGGAVQSFTGWYLTLPYDAGLTVAQRFQHEGNLYNVIEVNSGKSWSLFLYARLERV